MHDTAGGPGGRPDSPGGRWWAAVVDGLGALGTVLIGVLMVMISADIAARNVLGGSLPLISELSALTLVMIVFLQLGTTIRHDRMARIELFTYWLGQKSPRAHAVMDGLWNIFGAAACGAIAYSTVGILRSAYDHGDFIGVTGIMTLPTWPFRALILIGVAVAAIQFLLRATASFRNLADVEGRK